MNANAKPFSILAAGLISTALVILVAGCSSPSPSGRPPTTTANTSLPGRGGAALWAQNCGHCHNMRSPDSYSDAQWDVAMLHMRIRANLTPEEHRQILSFLKSAH